MKNNKKKTFFSGLSAYIFLVLIIFLLFFCVILLRKSIFPLSPGIFLLTSNGSSALAEGTFTLIGTNNYAASQATPDGKIIATLFAYNNKIYMGYGDYGANTGPIQVVAYDLTTGAFTPSLVSATTEAIYSYRVIGDSIYAPAIDPSGGLINYAYAIGEPWKNAVSNGINAAHSFDIATLTGNDIWIAGSSGNNAALWRSLDGGTTWTMVQTEPAVSGTVDDFARYYWAGVYKGKLYVQAYDYYGRAHQQSKVFDGVSWSTGPNLLSYGYGHRPLEFAGKLAFKSYYPPYTGYLVIFDGTKTQTAPYSISDFNVADGYLYIVSTDNTIRRSADLISWSTVTTGPSGSYSVAVLNDRLYVGTRDSKLYIYDIPLSQQPLPTPSPTTVPTPLPTPIETVPPTVTITYPIDNSTLTRNTSILITADAADNIGVARVEFYIDGVLKCTDSTAPYECRWKTTGKVDKTYVISAKAYDTSLNQTVSTVSVKSIK